MSKDTFEIHHDPRVIDRTEGRASRDRKPRIITPEYSKESAEPFMQKLQDLCEEYGVNAMMFFGIRHMKIGNRFATDFLGDKIGLNPTQERLYNVAKYNLRELEDQAFHMLGLLEPDGTIVDEKRLLDFIRSEGEFEQP